MRLSVEHKKSGCHPPLPVAARLSGTAATWECSSALIENSPGPAAAIHCIQPFDHRQGDSTPGRPQWAGSGSLEDIEKGAG